MRSPRLTAVALLVCLCAPAPVAGQRLPITSIDAASEVLQTETGARASEALDYVLANLNRAGADVLIFATMTALQTRNIRDAAFLFYAAQMRGRIDHQRFPPVGKGASDPAVALGALYQTAGALINPAILREPVAFDAVLDRLETWNPETTAGYQPGWQHTGALPAAAATKVIQSVKAEYMLGGRSMLSLVQNPVYLAALRELQDVGLADVSDAAKRRAAEERRSRAHERMCAIETEMKIEGMCRAQ